MVMAMTRSSRLRGLAIFAMKMPSGMAIAAQMRVTAIAMPRVRKLVER
ncbi:hypothetical protein ACFPRL_19505 [Pseudoclavibacter helvolus]